MVERVAERSRVALDRKQWGARVGQGSVEGCPVTFVLPQTFMNLSGECVAEALRALPVADVSSDVLVILDDADLPLGRLRLRARGGHGGHRGLADVLGRLGRTDVARLRFGIGRPAQAMDTADFVLRPFDREEEPWLHTSLERAADAVECFLREGIECAMNRFNAEPERS